MKNLIYKYIVYIIYFLGIGMTSSGIVLMPFNVMRYSTVLIIGLTLFIAGSIFNEIVVEKHHLSAFESIKFVVITLTLAIGIGMISGGIAHFKESPRYVSYLIPLGIIISFISFTLKNSFDMSKRDKLIVFAGVVIIAFLIFLALSSAANSMLMDNNMTPGGDIFKGGHGGQSEQRGH